MGQTRAADDDPAPPTQTQAAKFNALALRKLQLAIRKNPEVDLTTHLPKDYSNRLTGMRAVTKEPRYSKFPEKALPSCAPYLTISLAQKAFYKWQRDRKILDLPFARQAMSRFCSPCRSQ